jgi:soluble lytic murein transglycosylase
LYDNGRNVHRRSIRHALAIAGIAGILALSGPAVPRAEPPVDPVAALAPTIHPPVARDVATMWMAPSDAERAAAASNPAFRSLQTAVNLYSQEKYDEALARFLAAAKPESALQDHADYYAGVSELRLKRFEEARDRFSDLKDSKGFLSEAAALGEAEAAQALGDHGAAVRIYERLLSDKAVDEPAIWLSLATAATADGDRKRAAEAYLRLYYEHPLSEHAVEAEGPLQTMPEVQRIDAGNTRYKLELGRGERLFGFRRYPEARASLLRVKPHASGDDLELVTLRLAEVDYFSGRHRNALESLEPYLNRGARQAEARFFHAMSQRGLKNYGAFEQQARALVTDYPDSSWAEEALNNLGTHHIQFDRDDDADAVLREMYSRFPRGRYAERAAWKVGWKAYRSGNMDAAAEYFDTASGNFPRSDYRPAFLYWSGRAREAMEDRVGAASRYQLAVMDYQNSYYGRLATKSLTNLGTGSGQSNLIFVRNAAEMTGEGDHFPPTAGTIRTLLALGLYEPAVKELEFARKKWGDSPAIGATIAWANHQQSLTETGTRQFTLARGAITLMRRSYPQFMAAGGEHLPREILTTIFPLSYWDLIQKYSRQHDLDPYLMAALMAQESTFVPDIRSSAGAVGLMQLMPPTARLYARKLKMQYTASLRTVPEANVRMGMAYFADKIRQFGSVHLALASYNAGETPVRRWLAERGASLSHEEFIDDIPYPETQNYVKRILGTAEDYRRLYGPQ